MEKNKGVCCDVSACDHNINGCDCALDEIKVTTGDTDHMHFCKSYKCSSQDKKN